MTKDQPAENSEPSPVARGGDLPERRKTENLAGGLYYFEDELQINGALEARVVTAAGWLLEIPEIEAGEISFFVDDREIRPRFSRPAIFYPPFSITRPSFRNVRANLKGIAGTGALPEKFAGKAFVFAAGAARFPKSAAAVVEFLDARRDFLMVEAHPNASLLSLRAKRLIDENYRAFPSIARVAARLEVSHEHLTRQFKRDFRCSPSAYLHQLRIADAAFRLARGEPIIDVSGEVGYNDLSRFYKQFRKSTARAPGFCKAPK